MSKFFLISSCLSGALAVSIGAFGAHALKPTLQANGYLSTFETGVQYHFYHTLVLLLLGALSMKIETPLLNYAGYAFLVGIFIFSGSLYTLSITGIKWLGAITPIGGLGFIIGWVLLMLAVIKSY